MLDSEEAINGQIGGAILEEIRHFISCVKKGQCSTIVPPEVSAQSVRLAQAIVDSARLKKEIYL